MEEDRMFIEEESSKIQGFRWNFQASVSRILSSKRDIYL